MKALKIPSKNLLNMKMVVNYLNFVCLIEVKIKYKYTILNFFFQFIKTQNGTLGKWINHHCVLTLLLVIMPSLSFA